jgi:hypothetical protein
MCQTQEYDKLSVTFLKTDNNYNKYYLAGQDIYRIFVF